MCPMGEQRIGISNGLKFGGEILSSHSFFDFSTNLPSPRWWSHVISRASPAWEWGWWPHVACETQKNGHNHSIITLVTPGRCKNRLQCVHRDPCRVIPFTVEHNQNSPTIVSLLGKARRCNLKKSSSFQVVIIMISPNPWIRFRIVWITCVTCLPPFDPTLFGFKTQPCRCSGPRSATPNEECHPSSPQGFSWILPLPQVLEISPNTPPQIHDESDQQLHIWKLDNAL